MKRIDFVKILFKKMQEMNLHTSDGHDTYSIWESDAVELLEFFEKAGILPPPVTKIGYSTVIKIHDWEENITEEDWDYERERQNREY